MSAGMLARRAREMEDWAEAHWIDPSGVVYTFLDAATVAPATDATFGADQAALTVPGCTPAEWHNYENCGMVTGAYMLALLHRYGAERDPEALARARRCFRGLQRIYEMGKHLEEGFFPKIYGNRFSTETSTDQVLYVVLALDLYHRHAAAAEQAVVDRMIAAMVRFWVKREYRYSYFVFKDMQWPLGRSPSLLLLAHRHSGDPIFRQEYDRLLAAGVNRYPVEEQLRPRVAGNYEALPYEQERNAWLLYNLEGAASMDIMELDYLLRHDPQNAWAECWRRSLRQMWDEGRLALAPDGTAYTQFLVDMTTRQPRRPEPGFFKEYKPGDWWVGFAYVTGARTACSTFLARSAVQAQAHLRDADLVATARHILASIDIPGLVYYRDPERHLPELLHLTRLYSGDALANWPWAYWQGRVDGVFGASE